MTLNFPESTSYVDKVFDLICDNEPCYPSNLKTAARRVVDAIRADPTIIGLPSITPDQPAPTEDEVRELTRIINSVGWGRSETWAKTILAAGYRRQPDQRPTARQMRKALPEGSDTFNHVCLHFIDTMVAAGYAVPDPPEPERVPEFASVEEAEAWIERATNRQWSATRKYAPDLVWRAYGNQYIGQAGTYLEALQALANAVHAAQEGRDD